MLVLNHQAFLEQDSWAVPGDSAWLGPCCRRHLPALFPALESAVVSGVILVGHAAWMPRAAILDPPGSGTGWVSPSCLAPSPGWTLLVGLCSGGGCTARSGLECPLDLANWVENHQGWTSHLSELPLRCPTSRVHSGHLATRGTQSPHPEAGALRELCFAGGMRGHWREWYMGTGRKCQVSSA